MPGGLDQLGRPLTVCANPLDRTSFRGFAHPPGAMLAVLEDHGLRRTFQRHNRIWQVAGLERAS